MDVTLLYFEGCPGWRTADERLREALALVGRSDAEVAHRRVSTAEEAEAARFHGSPTVWVDGRDPFTPGSGPVGLSCRLYRTPQGLAVSPTVEQLVEVLGVIPLRRRDAETAQVPCGCCGRQLPSSSVAELGSTPGVFICGAAPCGRSGERAASSVSAGPQSTSLPGCAAPARATAVGGAALAEPDTGVATSQPGSPGVHRPHAPPKGVSTAQPLPAHAAVTGEVSETMLPTPLARGGLQEPPREGVAEPRRAAGPVPHRRPGPAS